MNTRTLTTLVVASTMLMQTAWAKPHTPAKGSAERSAIMNSMRRVLGSGKHKAIITAYHLKVENGWAFMGGGFNYADGAPLEEEYQEGSGTNFTGLLHLESGHWRIKKWTYNGDVQSPTFMAAFPKAPRAIFKGDHGEM